MFSNFFGTKRNNKSDISHLFLEQRRSYQVKLLNGRAYRSFMRVKKNWYSFSVFFSEDRDHCLELTDLQNFDLQCLIIYVFRMKH